MVRGTAGLWGGRWGGEHIQPVCYLWLTKAMRYRITEKPERHKGFCLGAKQVAKSRTGANQPTEAKALTFRRAEGFTGTSTRCPERQQIDPVVRFLIS